MDARQRKAILPIFGTGLAGCTWWDIPGFTPLRDASTAWEIRFAKLLPDVLAAAEAGLSVRDDLVLFDSQAAEDAGLSQMDVPAIRRIVEGLNGALTNGYLSLEQGWQTVVSKSAAYSTGTLYSATLGSLTLTIDAAAHWWGCEITLSKALVQKFQEDMAKATFVELFVATLAALLGQAEIAVPATYLVALTGIAVGNLSVMDWCHGVRILIFQNTLPTPFVVKIPVL